MQAGNLVFGEKEHSLLLSFSCSAVHSGTSNWPRIGLNIALTSICPNLTTAGLASGGDRRKGCNQFLGDYKPTTGELFQYLGHGAMVPLILAMFAEAVMIALFLAEVCIVSRLGSNPEHLRRWTLLVLSTFPMDGFVNLVALLSPKSYDTILVYHLLSRSWCLASFYLLSKRLISGAHPEVSRLFARDGHKLSASRHFLCCMAPAKIWNLCYVSEGRRKSEASLVMSFAHMQAFPVLITLLLISSVLERGGLWIPQEVGTVWSPSAILPILEFSSYAIALIGHCILLCNFKLFLDHFNYSAKLTCIELINVTGLFWIFRAILLQLKSAPCIYPISSPVFSTWICFGLMQLFLPATAVLAWFAFVEPLRKADRARRDPIYTVTSGLGTPPTSHRARAESMEHPLFPLTELLSD